MRIGLYARVSTQRQAQADGLTQPLDRLHAHALRQGWTVQAEHAFRDDGYSGASGRGAWIRGAGAMPPTPFWAHAMRADSGRPSSSMRFRTWTATSISVARRSSVRERSPSPITRLNRPMVASARARAL